VAVSGKVSVDWRILRFLGKMHGRILIGTSGWSYPSGEGTWNGLFYPRPRPRGFDELAYYASFFTTVEVNTTFYGPPRAEIARAWRDRTPREFDFSIKLFQKFTHPKMFKAREAAKAPGSEGSLLDWVAAVTQSDIDEFRAGLEPLAAAGKVGALLAQFPPSFKYEPRAIDYLDALLRAFGDYPMAVELRHRSWSDHFTDTIGLLNAHDAAFVQIDEPKFRTSIRQNQLPNITGSYYMRLHGRNAAQWWHHAHRDDRYNYLYSAAELGDFATVLTSVERIVKHRVRAYLNNHFSAKSIVNAATLQSLVGEPVSGDYPGELRARYPEMGASPQR
jgi:uncharacterized protein YecE (DUF72 family)